MGGSVRYFFVLTSGLSCVVLLFILNYRKVSSHDFLSDSIQAKREKIKSMQLASGNSDFLSKIDEINYSRLLLTDSVLSIIKNYYVDKHRTSSVMIMHSLINFLRNQTPVSVKEDERFWQLRLGGKSVRLARPGQISYDLLLHHILTIGSFLKNTRDFKDYGVKKGPMAGLHLVLKSLLLSLDAHSTLLSAESYHELRQGTEGTFGGLGVLVGMRDQLLTVLKPLPSSPAERVGILKMDRILSIDGRDTYGYSLGDLVEYMRGAPGTKVNLSLLRDGAFSVRDIQLRREIIRVDSVSSRHIKKPWGTVLYASVESFTARTSSELLKAIQNYERKVRGRKIGLILDLRSNPGGLLDQAVYVADLFLDKGVIVSTKGRSTDIEYAHFNRKVRTKSPVIVLINNESASASEIVAGALQDHNRALIIGQPSFGKGSVQTIFELPDDRALKLTIARYYTPLGKSIQNIGIVPDIWLQPVLKKGINENLLGGYRYKNERFLPNHLISGGREQVIQVRSRVRQPIKSYYLVEKNDPEKRLVDGEADKDLDLALNVFKEVASVYGSVRRNASVRAGNLLATAAAKVREITEKHSEKTMAFLQKSYALDWSVPDAPLAPQTGAVFKILTGNKIQMVAPGETVAIPFLISNPGQKALHHVSAFVRHQSADIDTSEILMGEISAGATRKGTLHLKVPAYWKKGLLVYEAGLAFGAQADVSLLRQIRFQVKERKVPDLNVHVALTDEVGGHVNGELEPAETAKLLLNIQNNSGVAARSIQIKLINLAGKQLILVDKSRNLKYLAPFQRRQVYFSLKGADKVIDPKMGLGLFIESSDLPLPIRKKATISSVPGPGQKSGGTSRR